MGKTWTGIAGVMLLAAMGAMGAVDAARAGVIASDATPGRFDGDSGVRILRVTEHGPVGAVSIAIDFAKCNDPGVGEDGQCIDNTGSFDNEIVFRLISPDGLALSLVEPWTYASDGVGAGRVTVRFDDAAAWQVGSAEVDGGKVAAGSFRPLEALAGLNGTEMFGDWQLVVGDAGYGDPLQYFGARLEVARGGPAEVAEPGALAVFGAGLLGLGAALRRRGRA
jgi:hypothetical protein